MVGNILNFNYLIKQISVAQTAGDMLKIYFYLGRFVYLVLYFQPLAAVPNYNSLNPSQSLEVLQSFSKVYQNVATSPPVLFASEVSNATMALLNNAVGAAGGNVTVCNNDIISFLQGLQSLDTHIAGAQYSALGDDLAGLVALVDPVCESCFYALIA